MADIDQNDIRDTLAPLWHTKADTAKKALNRLGICLKHGAALGFDVDLQATEKAKALLGKQRHKVTHVPSVPWRNVPAFYASLDDGSVTHLALRLLILTGVRSAPLRFMRLEHIDGNVLTVPGEQMKGRRDVTLDFRVPLSHEALAIIEQAKRHEREVYDTTHGGSWAIQLRDKTTNDAGLRSLICQVVTSSILWTSSGAWLTRSTLHLA